MQHYQESLKINRLCMPLFWLFWFLPSDSFSVDIYLYRRKLPCHIANRSWEEFTIYAPFPGNNWRTWCSQIDEVLSFNIIYFRSVLYFILFFYQKNDFDKLLSVSKLWPMHINYCKGSSSNIKCSFYLSNLNNFSFVEFLYFFFQYHIREMCITEELCLKWNLYLNQTLLSFQSMYFSCMILHSFWWTAQFFLSTIISIFFCSY